MRISWLLWWWLIWMPRNVILLILIRHLIYHLLLLLIIISLPILGEELIKIELEVLSMIIVIFLLLIIRKWFSPIMVAKLLLFSIVLHSGIQRSFLLATDVYRLTFFMLAHFTIRSLLLLLNWLLILAVVSFLNELLPLICHHRCNISQLLLILITIHHLLLLL